jgi:hypothetical protein
MMLESLISYLKQPSTYQGLSTIATAVGWVAFPQYFELMIVAYGIVMGGISVVKNDSPEKELLKKKQLIAKAKQMGLTLKE